MARDLIRRSGFKPGVDIEVKFIGLRPGEKLYEELITEGEGIVRTPHGKIFVLKGNNCDLNWLNQKIEELVTLAYDQDVHGIKSKLKEIVPDYQPFDMNDHTPPNPPINLSDSAPPLSDPPRRPAPLSPKLT